MGSAPDDEQNTPLSIFTALSPPLLSVADGSRTIYYHLFYNDDNALFHMITFLTLTPIS